MKRLWQFAAALLVGLTLTMSAKAASHLADPIDPSVIVMAGGMEWVWSGPCATENPSCGVSVLRDGFMIPTDAQWLASFANTAALAAAFTNGAGGAICGSPYFNTVYDHCDMGDLTIGAVWHAPNPIGVDGLRNDSAAESFLVRSAVPEPETYAMLLAGLSLLGAAARRRSHS